MNVCVTGGTGFIGGPLCALLLSQGDRVRILSRKEQPAVPGREVFAGDLLQPHGELRQFFA